MLDAVEICGPNWGANECGLSPSAVGYQKLPLNWALPEHPHERPTP
jgi:hypothetical protein